MRSTSTDEFDGARNVRRSSILQDHQCDRGRERQIDTRTDRIRQIHERETVCAARPGRRRNGTWGIVQLHYGEHVKLAVNSTPEIMIDTDRDIFFRVVVLLIPRGFVVARIEGHHEGVPQSHSPHGKCLRLPLAEILVADLARQSAES